MTPISRIVHAEITPARHYSFADWLNPARRTGADDGLHRVTATLEDGRRELVMRYYGELHFTPEQFVGLGSDEVAALYFAVDDAFVQRHPGAARSRIADLINGTERAGPLAF